MIAGKLTYHEETTEHGGVIHNSRVRQFYFDSKARAMVAMVAAENA